MNLERLRGMPIALLRGGTSPEREVSFMSAAAVEQALRDLGADLRPVDTADEHWWQQVEGAALAYIMLHGEGGEDGVVQGTLECLGVPYTGSGVMASALAMDKPRAKLLWRGVGLPTAEFEELDEGSDWPSIISRLGRCFVKPATGGSSIGARAASDAAELETAYREARRYDSRVIAERFIEGPEYTVSILGEQVLPAIRMETDNEFYDYQAKYLSDDTRYLCPCGLPAAVEAELGQLAWRAFNALGCRVWGRVDFMRDADGDFLLLEANTVPGMTGHSLVPMAAAEVGVGFVELVGRIACLSLEGAAA
jgi:D-alanine-D-alanine ligase